jgi:hypothetical protein
VQRREEEISKSPMRNVVESSETTETTTGIDVSRKKNFT